MGLCDSNTKKESKEPNHKAAIIKELYQEEPKASH